MEDLVKRFEKFSGYKLTWSIIVLGGVRCLSIDAVHTTHPYSLTIDAYGHEVSGRLRHWGVTPSELEVMVRTLTGAPQPPIQMVNPFTLCD